MTNLKLHIPNDELAQSFLDWFVHEGIEHFRDKNGKTLELKFHKIDVDNAIKTADIFINVKEKK